MANVYDVTFPKLNLRFSINPVAFKFLSVSVYWYGILVCLGFVLGFLYSLHKAKVFGINKNKITDVAIVSVASSIVGARAYYVVFCTDINYYLNNPIKIFAVNEGGLAVYGGIIFAVVTACILCKIEKINYLKVLDVSTFGLLTGQSIGRWGNFFNQEAFGTQTDFLLGMCSENTGNVPVHPCFLYESIWCFFGIIFLENINRRRYSFNGQLFLCYMLWYGIGRFFIESIRSDSLLIPFTKIKISKVISLILIIVSLIAFFARFFNKRFKKMDYS